MSDEVRRRRNNINYAIQLDAINRRRPGISRCGDRRVIGERYSQWKKTKENRREREIGTERWEKVAAWRPVRRGKNDRALTRYKSHYGVNLLDPSPPTDFQPPGTVLGCRLWATSHANSDKVPLSPSCSLCLSLSFSPSRLLRSFSVSFTAFNVLPTYHPRHFPPILSMSLSFYLLLCLSSFVRQAIPTRGIPGHPNPYGPEPGNICPRDICVLIESPISSLIERTIGRFSLSPSPLFSVPL